MWQKAFGVFVISVFLSSAAWALGDVSAGEKIPHDLTATDQHGEARSFDTLKGERGLTLAFVRSADWCPFCQKQLKDFNDHVKAFAMAGYPLVTISYDSAEILKNFSDKNSIEYTMLSDPRSEIIQAFGLLNEEYAVGTFAYGVPHPAIYIIDESGVIENIFYEENYRQRPLTEDVLNAIATDVTAEPPVIPEVVEPAPSIEATPEPAPQAAPEPAPATQPEAGAVPEAEPQTGGSVPPAPGGE